MAQTSKLSGRGPRKQITVSLPAEAHRAIELLSAQRRISMNTLAQGWILSSLATVPGYRDLVKSLERREGETAA